MWLLIILPEEAAVLLQEIAGPITTDRVTVTPEITVRDTGVIQGRIIVDLQINQWEEVQGLIVQVPEVVLQDTEEVLPGTGEVHQE